MTVGSVLASVWVSALVLASVSVSALVLVLVLASDCRPAQSGRTATKLNAIATSYYPSLKRKQLHRTTCKLSRNRLLSAGRSSMLRC